MTTARPPFLVRHADLIHSLKSFAAAIAAFMIALWIDLPRPYWAMATVYITSQPFAGATQSKALFRIAGTLLGAAATVALVPNLVGAPELLCLAIALWVGLCLCISLLDRTPRSYMFMLAGYTVALIGFPAVTEPATIFDTALARVEEISLGIICATLVSTIVLPRSLGPAVAGRVDSWLADARRLSQAVLYGHGADGPQRALRLRLAADAVEIDNLADHLAYDRSVDVSFVPNLQALRLRMLMLPPLLASIADRIDALGRHGVVPGEHIAVPGEGLATEEPPLRQLIDELAEWVARDDAGRRSADSFRAAIAAQLPVLQTRASWYEIVTASLLLRMRELVDISQDCRTLQRAIAVGEPVAADALLFHPEGGAAPVRHRDVAMAVWSGGGAALAILACCAFWIGTGWQDGASAPMMAAVGCSFFAAQDDPSVGIRSFGLWSIAAMVVVALYLFAILPGISNVELLVAAIAPAFLVFGLLMARPQTTFIGMALSANTATLLALQASYSADFGAFVNSSVAFLVGVELAVIVSRLARSVGAEWSTRRLVRHGWVTLALAAEHRGRRDRAVFAGVMMNRIGLLAQRLSAMPADAAGDSDGLRELRVGLNIVDLRRARHGLSAPTLRATDAMLDELAAAFRHHDGGAMPPGLLARIDEALGHVMSEDRPDARDDAVIGLVGIRRALFPAAAAYAPDPSLSLQQAVA
ncbi:FUSC family protein [Bradyrhizobium sp. U87765 SZCCT0131]|uniref:FUSC family protein n=1 Tax=unclassified Bradyrhizobium TaxID=2631580 RepID=UPI001BA63B47|nr:MULTISPECIES: FUSC family protein [unclassified Bradyrhizobium]MBR1222264.1 FUSC family protein [Bradyrhizobium sp. U87765 SZCCT0131]MBR1264252.1 FUSC family protein [Bradyrhizobium sp. U87765 SZCCT0134]MBR1307965.1 FUSC family protein [Bradyrhizobium sp. U87765 SZCCT0110]MBR1320502.1 FUSC family protein [Bradyrhizobium sp. U87765 SZCCT0109]MBR1348385.1 FUSC family protein [Bradyrhizobium sp. U87765 SZCCT0048]